MKKGFKHSEKTKKQISNYVKAHPVKYWLGRKMPAFSLETRKRMSESHEGKQFSKEHRKNISLSKKGNKWNIGRRGRKLSEKHKKLLSELARKRIGKKHWNWKGGITSLTEQIRKCFEYRQWRSDVFTRDDFTCVLCGKRGGIIHADHFPKRFSLIFRNNKISSFQEALNCEEFWNINNGRTLCKECHKKTDTWGNKR